MLDGSAVHRILNNLVGNAIKFTSEGSVTVTLGQCEKRVCIDVTDTGMGISEDFLPHIFDEFRQEHLSGDESPEGSGLGLAITKRLVQNMNGRISVQSVKGKGTTFRVEFPMVSEVAQPGSETSRFMAAPPTAPGNRSYQNGRFRSVA